MLEGLTIDGLGVGSNGILINSVGTLAVLNCSISDMKSTTGNGIAFTFSNALDFVIDGCYIARSLNGILVKANNGGAVAIKAP